MAPRPDGADTPESAATAFARGLVALDRYLYGLQEAALPHAVEAFRSAVALEPDHPTAWAALGFVLDAAGRPEDALAALQRAAALAPGEHDVEVFVITLLSEAGAEVEALAAVRAAAGRAGVDVDALEGDLSASGLPVDSRTLLLNGFIRPRNFLRSRLQDEIDRMRRKADPAEWERQRVAEAQECFARQAELARDFELARVPPRFHELASWAIRLGVGDDFYRAMLLESLTGDERQTMVRAVDQEVAEVQEWIDTFEPGALSTEAAAFMYLLLGAEEIRGTD